ncbi:hypothetical protein HGRIS_003702 [Hohenbuehelia grisea]|uniref:Vomeronasal type-1 receptor n=1 Tax=Hohenbuehelia grisea TaxID=104357 RepID=A0ABR3JH12_9AGAR
MILAFVPSAAIAYLEVSTLKYRQLKGNESGCQLAHASPIIFIAYVLLMGLETTIVGLTMYQAIRHLRFTKSAWIVSFYRDGLLYYFYVLGISTANVLIPVLAPPSFSNWLATPQRVIHSVICTRVLLFMRELPERTSPLNDSIPLSNLSFAQRSRAPEETSVRRGGGTRSSWVDSITTL